MATVGGKEIRFLSSWIKAVQWVSFLKAHSFWKLYQWQKVAATHKFKALWMCVCVHICMNVWVYIFTTLFISIKTYLSQQLSLRWFLHTRGHCVCALQVCLHIYLPGGSVVKNLPASAGDAGFLIQTLDWEDSLYEEMASYSSILASEIPWTEESGVTKSQTQLCRHEHYTYIPKKGECLCLEPSSDV